MEKRVLLAFAVSAVIFMVWSTLVAPPPRPVVSEATPGEAAGPESLQAGPAAAAVEVAEPEPEPEAPPVLEAVAAEMEEVVTVDNGLVKIELTNRGGAIRSVVLKGYTGDGGEPLELVQAIEHPQRTLPLQLESSDGPEDRLYTVEAVDGGARFQWGDGSGAWVEKTITLEDGRYEVRVAMEMKGSAARELVSVGTGMRNIGSVEFGQNRFATWGDVVWLPSGEKVEKRKRGKVKEAFDVPTAGLRFLGFQDTYFLSVFRPRTPLTAARVEALALDEDEAAVDSVLKMTMAPAQGVLEGSLLLMPKEYGLLQEVDDGVEGTLTFGFFHPISVLLLKILWWIHARVGNYGAAIILLTLAIRIVLFPLMHKSTVSMRRMQKLQPKVKAIQEKYKKGKKDPQVRAKMNQETMELYKTEGVNPMGGCLPLLVQLPILWALYTLFMQAIELRHAPFMLWIMDLSVKDPYYITPILMTFTMWLQQKLAPQAGDAQQQRIFRLMPLIFGIMFLQFPSGLVLYWLTNNILTIVQQEITLRLIGERKPRGGKKAGK